VNTPSFASWLKQFKKEHLQDQNTNQKWNVKHSFCENESKNKIKIHTSGCSETQIDSDMEQDSLNI
jgi:hypothetical protein